MLTSLLVLTHTGPVVPHIWFGFISHPSSTNPLSHSTNYNNKTLLLTRENKGCIAQFLKMKVLHQMHHWACFGVVYMLVLELQKASNNVSILFCASLPRGWGYTVRPLSLWNQLLNKLMPWLHSALDFYLSLEHSLQSIPEGQAAGSTPFLQHRWTSGFIAGWFLCSAACDLSFFPFYLLCLFYPNFLSFNST